MAARLLFSFFTFLVGVALVSVFASLRFTAQLSNDPAPAPPEPGTVTATVTRLVPLEPEPARKFTGLASVEVRRHDPEFEVSEMKVPARPVMQFDLGLGESIENQLIVLHPHPGDASVFKVEQQFETSMAIGDEGPHWDFTDWKHHTSQWRQIESVSASTFLTSKIAESDYTKFPKVTRREIVSEIMRSGADERWAELARQCTGPNSGPCYVSVSRISFRISSKENGKWKEIHRIDFSVPMGC